MQEIKHRERDDDERSINDKQDNNDMATKIMSLYTRRSNSYTATQRERMNERERDYMIKEVSSPR